MDYAVNQRLSLSEQNCLSLSERYSRMEISGARWGINGSESILKLRSVAKSKDWDDYWEFFTTQAKNDTFFPDEYNLMNVQEKMVA